MVATARSVRADATAAVQRATDVSRAASSVPAVGAVCMPRALASIVLPMVWMALNGSPTTEPAGSRLPGNGARAAVSSGHLASMIAAARCSHRRYGVALSPPALSEVQSRPVRPAAFRRSQ
jgi:hypothetical protein